MYGPDNAPSITMNKLAAVQEGGGAPASAPRAPKPRAVDEDATAHGVISLADQSELDDISGNMKRRLSDTAYKELNEELTKLVTAAEKHAAENPLGGSMSGVGEVKGGGAAGNKVIIAGGKAPEDAIGSGEGRDGSPPTRRGSNQSVTSICTTDSDLSSSGGGLTALVEEAEGAKEGVEEAVPADEYTTTGNGRGKRSENTDADLESYASWDLDRRRRSSGDRRRAALVTETGPDGVAVTTKLNRAEYGTDGHIHLKKNASPIDHGPWRKGFEGNILSMNPSLLHAASTKDDDMKAAAQALAESFSKQGGVDDFGLSLEERSEFLIQSLTGGSEVLGTLGKLSELPKGLQVKTIAAFTPKAFAEGRVIFRNGAYTDTFYVVKSGTFAAYSKAVDNGNSPVTTYTRGMVMCERALIGSAKQPKLSITCLKSGELYCLLGSAYRAILDGAVIAGASEVDNLRFLSSLPACSSLPPESLQKLSALGELIITESSDELQSIFLEGSEMDEVFLIKSGQITCALPKAQTSKRNAAVDGGGSSKEGEKLVTLKPGDLLGPVALAWFAKLQAKGKGRKHTMRKGVSWAPLPEASADYPGEASSTPASPSAAVAGSPAGSTSFKKTRAAAETSGVALLRFSLQDFDEIAPALQVEARVGIIRKVLKAMEGAMHQLSIGLLR